MNPDLSEIITLLQDRTGHDFSGYKDGTLNRRIERRMSLHQEDDLGRYRDLLTDNPDEAETLASELLIGVTSFFREPETWRKLREVVLPELFEDKAEGEVVRAWVAGCASGEEAYTLAMVLWDFREEHHPQVRFQIFATDVDPEGIATARSGVYESDAVESVPEGFRERFFHSHGGRCRIRQELREMVVFAPQDLTSDPPFSNMDLVLCRNVLIYLKPAKQQQVYRLLHFALRPGGVLMLGTAESLSQESHLFSAVAKQERIFRSLRTDRRFLDLPHHSLDTYRVAERPSRVSREDFTERAQGLLVERFVPPSVLVDDQHRICYFHGDTSPYLAQVAGEPTADLLELARPGLSSVLLAALHRAQRTGERVEIRSAMVESARGPTDAGASDPGTARERPVRALVDPVPGEEHEAPLYLVSFEEVDVSTADGTDDDRGPAVVQGLEDELKSAREELKATVDQLKVANEELRAANEESMSMNEELRSTNEELEASKEELQAMNEELRSLNVQLEDNVDELEVTNSDLSNLLRSTEVATVFLDEQLRVRRFTPSARRLFKIIDSDIDRPLEDLVWRFEDDRLLADARSVLKDGKRQSQEIANDDDCWFIRRLLPYSRDREDGTEGGDPASASEAVGVEGVVLTFSEVTRLKSTQAALRLNEERFRVTLKGSPVVVWQQDTDLRYTWIHNSHRSLGDQILGKRDEDFLKPEEAAELREVKRRVLETGEGARTDFTVRFPDGLHTYDLFLEPLRGPEGDVVGLTGAGVDITDRIEIEAALRARESQLREQASYLEDMEAHRDEFLAMLAHELRNPMYPIRSAAELIAQEADEATSGRLSWAVGVVQRQVRQMTRLVDDLLDMARITRDQIVLRKDEVELERVVDQAVETVAPLLESKGHELTLDLPEEPVRLTADGSRLAQILASLLTNAGKFTEPGGHIELLARRQGDEVVVQVRDNGEGIPQDLLPRVFDLFRQGHSPLDRSKGGLGLGLTLVRRLVELHDGSVEAASEGEGMGSTFTIRLPLTAPPIQPKPAGLPAQPPVPERSEVETEAETKTETETGATAARKVLVVDDNPDAADAMSMLLELQGYETVTALDGKSAVATAREFEPDVVFLDIGLPEMDGYEVAQVLRRELGQDLLLVALTGYGQDKDRQRSEEAGFDHHLLKPASLDQIREVLEGG